MEQSRCHEGRLKNESRQYEIAFQYFVNGSFIALTSFAICSVVCLWIKCLSYDYILHGKRLVIDLAGSKSRTIWWPFKAMMNKLKSKKGCKVMHSLVEVHQTFPAKLLIFHAKMTWRVVPMMNTSIFLLAVFTLVGMYQKIYRLYIHDWYIHIYIYISEVLSESPAILLFQLHSTLFFFKELL